MKTNSFPTDINTHEFTLACLEELYENVPIFNKNISVLSKKIRRVNFKGKLRFAAVLGIGYYAYKDLNNRLKKIEKDEVIEEKTTE